MSKTPMSDTQEKLEEILSMAFVGLYAKQPSSDGMSFDYVDLHDTYGVLKADLRKDLLDLIKSAKREGAIEELERVNSYSDINWFSEAESITRARRMLRAEYPGSDQVEERRYEKFQSVRGWDFDDL